MRITPWLSALAIVVVSAWTKGEPPTTAPTRFWETTLEDGRRLVVDREDLQQAKGPGHIRYIFQVEETAGTLREVWSYWRGNELASGRSPEIGLLTAGVSGDSFLVIFNQMYHCWAYVVCPTSDGKWEVKPRGKEAVVTTVHLAAGRRAKSARIISLGDDPVIQISHEDGSIVRYGLVEDEKGIWWRPKAPTTQPGK